MENWDGIIAYILRIERSHGFYFCLVSTEMVTVCGRGEGVMGGGEEGETEVENKTDWALFA